ncbi:GntR family transcriptional regulator, partial [Verminephrobacter sp. Larva24]
MTKLERISNAIIEAIESGALREGHRLPSEEELAVQHRVSVGTMQKALARLAHAG